MLKLRAFNYLTKRWRWVDAPSFVSVIGPFTLDGSLISQENQRLTDLEDGTIVLSAWPVIRANYVGTFSELRCYIDISDGVSYSRLGRFDLNDTAFFLTDSYALGQRLVGNDGANTEMFDTDIFTVGMAQHNCFLKARILASGGTAADGEVDIYALISKPV